MGIPQQFELHQHGVSVEFAHDDEHRLFSANFKVQKSKQFFWLTNQNFQAESKKNWGLWNYDVVEVFLQPRLEITYTHTPYIELQVSPLNQGFNLVIIEPRQIYYTPLDLRFFHETVLTETNERYIWNTKLTLELPFYSKYLFGNCFACLGQGENREYFGLNLKPGVSPDFHRPDYFIPFNLGRG